MDMEGCSEGVNGRLSKRPRSSQILSPSPVNQQRGSTDYEPPIPQSQYLLDEPGPLGLRLRKSQSLLELIEKTISEGNTSSLTMESSGNRKLHSQKYAKNITSIANDKMKAANFPASLLRIGSWEYVSSYENDLVAKCYFAKQKLVWEILEGALKSKIEIQWSDIMALKATCPDDVPGTLTIVLGRQPIFFREINPQPRKHTIWQPSTDFTGGQASINRKHFLQCPPGALNKYYEKLIQCDRRLYILSQQLEMVVDWPYFGEHASVLESPEEFRGHKIDQLKAAEEYSPSSFMDVDSTVTTQSSPLSFGQNPIGMTAKHMSKEALSPCSVMDTRAIEWNGTIESQGFLNQKSWEQPKIPGLLPSISMDNLLNHFESHISEQVTSGSVLSDRASELWEVIENIKHDLLSDTQHATGLDEKCLLKKVKSLCCLLQDADAASSSSANVNEGNNNVDGANCGKHIMSSLSNDPMYVASQEPCTSAFGCTPVGPASMSRIDSFGEFVLHLPRVTSLSEF